MGFRKKAKKIGVGDKGEILKRTVGSFKRALSVTFLHEQKE